MEDNKRTISEYCPECPLIENSDSRTNAFDLELQKSVGKSELTLVFSPAGNQFNFTNNNKANFIVVGFCTSVNAANNFSRYLKDNEFKETCKKSTFSGGQLRINLLRIFNGLNLFEKYNKAFNISKEEFEGILAKYREGSLKAGKYFKKHIFEENDRIFYTQVLKCCVKVKGSSNQNVIIRSLENDNFELVKKCIDKFMSEVQERARNDGKTFIFLLGSVLEKFLTENLGLFERLERLGTIITVPHPAGNNTDRITIFSGDSNVGKETYSKMRRDAMSKLDKASKMI
jgi:hypothetical protein